MPFSPERLHILPRFAPYFRATKASWLHPLASRGCFKLTHYPVRRDEVRNVRNTALNGAAVRRFADPKMNRYVPFSNFEDSGDVTNKGLRGHPWPPISCSSESSESSML